MKKAIITIFYSKIIVILLVIMAFNLLPFSKESYFANFHLPNSGINLQTAFSTWDAQHYLNLAQYGYKTNTESVRFFPVFPLLIYLVSPIVGYFFAGFIIANIASFIGFIYFYLFVKEFLHSEKTAYKSLLLFLIFPTSFFFVLLYSESIFFCFVMLLFYFLYKKNFLTASILAFLLPLVRPTGIFIIIPVFIYMIMDYRENIFFLSKEHFSKTHISFRPSFFPFMFSILGVGVYFIFMQIATGNPFAGFAFQNDLAGHFTQFSFHWNFLSDIFPQKLTLHDPNNSLLDRLFFLGFISSLPLIWKKTDKVLFAYALSMGLVPLLGSFMSYMRYLLMVFPLWIALGSVFEEKKFSWLTFFYVYPAFLMQGLFIILQSLNLWVA